eukprot:gnl/Chilomastix_cuspidata/4004.p1 GENE.gnl/Chilomastix_cuspidata/4004~~gnl/Chilomastix_cuspidata/4004.p1  ORF type:complete len:464 (-),score=212.26 gnl/Chilomastix_cuspidata/4004:20-1291(-)
MPYDPLRNLEKQINLILDPCVAPSKKPQILRFLISDFSSTSSHLTDAFVPLGMISFYLLAREGVAPGPAPEPADTLNLMRGAAEALKTSFLQPFALTKLLVAADEARAGGPDANPGREREFIADVIARFKELSEAQRAGAARTEDVLAPGFFKLADKMTILSACLLHSDAQIRLSAVAAVAAVAADPIRGPALLNTFDMSVVLVEALFRAAKFHATGSISAAATVASAATEKEVSSILEQISILAEDLRPPLPLLRAQLQEFLVAAAQHPVYAPSALRTLRLLTQNATAASSIANEEAVRVLVELITPSLDRDSRVLVCGTLRNLLTLPNCAALLTPHIETLCPILEKRSSDDPTYVLDLCAVLRAASVWPPNAKMIRDALKDKPSILIACMAAPPLEFRNEAQIGMPVGGAARVEDPEAHVE